MNFRALGGSCNKLGCFPWVPVANCWAFSSLCMSIKWSSVSFYLPSIILPHSLISLYFSFLKITAFYSESTRVPSSHQSACQATLVRLSSSAIPPVTSPLCAWLGYRSFLLFSALPFFIPPLHHTVLASVDTHSLFGRDPTLISHWVRKESTFQPVRLCWTDLAHSCTQVTPE